MKRFLSNFIAIGICFSVSFSAFGKTSAELREEAEAANVKVEEFLTKCFQDYLKQLAKPNDKVKKRCVSIPFRTEWKKIATVKNVDPLLLVETPEPSWKSHVEVADANARLKSAKVFLGEEPDQHCLKIKIETDEDDIKIASTRPCSK